METRVIEINGTKFEVDLRTAKRVDVLKVGTKVKVLKKNYGDTFALHPGIVVGFEPFEVLPTVVIAYVEQDYTAAKLHFLHYNAKSKDVEIVADIDDALDVSKADVSALFERERAKLRAQIEEIDARENYFLNNFRQYWEKVSA